MSDQDPDANASRFTSSGHAAEDLLKSQTVGLVHLSDFRKRRAEALEQSGASSGASTPTGGESREQTPKPPGFKKRKKGVKKNILSFGDDDEEEASLEQSSAKAKKSGTATPQVEEGEREAEESAPTLVKKRLKPNANSSVQIKVQTKASLAKEAALRETLRKQYLATENAVRNTEFVLPFVFFEAKEVAAGKVRLKKGDQVWLLLERARKIGIELGEGGIGPAGVGSRRREWARITVDDMILVAGEMILPHRFDFHTLILNKSAGFHGPLFPFHPGPTAATPAHLIPDEEGNVPTPPAAETPEGLLAEDRKIPDAELEGFDRDPSLLKVVDRRWYEKNKHIYPMSIWEDFDPAQDYSEGGKKDREGNAFFFSGR